MHRPRLLGLVAALTVLGLSTSGQQTLRSQLVGHWRLLGAEVHEAGRPPQASLGPSPVGVIAYTADGRMQAQLTLGARPRVRSADASAEVRRELARYTAYFGTYTVDEAARTVTHHREGSFDPTRDPLVRHIALEGSRLTLTTPTTTVNDVARHSTIRWERIPEAPTADGRTVKARAAVAGTWRLVDHRTVLANGEVRHAFGPTPRGLFFFDAAGHTAVQIENPERPATPLARASDDDLQALARTYLAYFGSYDVDPATKAIVVHTAADLNPLNTGVDQTRYFTLDGDLLILQPPPTSVAGGQQVSRITWQRVR